MKGKRITPPYPSLVYRDASTSIGIRLGPIFNTRFHPLGPLTSEQTTHLDKALLIGLKAIQNLEKIANQAAVMESSRKD